MRQKKEEEKMHKYISIVNKIKNSEVVLILINIKFLT